MIMGILSSSTLNETNPFIRKGAKSLRSGLYLAWHGESASFNEGSDFIKLTVLEALLFFSLRTKQLLIVCPLFLQ